MFQINQYKVDHINKAAAKLIELIEYIPEEAEAKVNKNSSIHHKPSTELKSEFIEDSIVISHFDPINNKRVDVKKPINGINFGIKKEKYTEVEKLLKQLNKEKTLSNILSESFVEKKMIEWLFISFRAQQVLKLFFDYLVEESKKTVEPNKILFFIDNLEINKSFNIGGCLFNFFTTDYIEKLIKKRKEIRDDLDIEEEIEFMESFKGKVFVHKEIYAEEKKAIELAFIECSLAIDSLKITSLIHLEPNIIVCFDIDKRRKFSKRSTTLIQENDQPWFFRFIEERNANLYYINDESWNWANGLGLLDFSDFMKDRHSKECELSDLIVNNIGRYADAISKPNLNQRIVDLYTVLESLLLKNETDSIIESVSNYCSKLITKDVDERKTIVKTIKNMYKIRSSLVHHGKEKDFDIDELKKLQLIVIMLLRELIVKYKTHSTKNSILRRN